LLRLLHVQIHHFPLPFSTTELGKRLKAKQGAQ
jgi:hypothetical protein